VDADAIGDTVVVSARPEAVQIADKGLAATIVDQTFLGPHNQVRAKLAGGEEIEFLVFSHGATTERTPGQPVALAFDQSRLNYFAPESGKTVMRSQQ